MAAMSVSGASSHWRSSRPPIGVWVSSRTQSSEPRRSPRSGGEQLEVAAGGLVDVQHRLRRVALRHPQMLDAGAMGGGEVAEQRAERGSDARRRLGAVARRASAAPAAASKRAAGSGVSIAVGQAARSVAASGSSPARTSSSRGARRPSSFAERRRRRRATVCRVSPVDRSTASSASRLAVARHRRQVVRLLGIEALLLGDRARGDDAHHGARRPAPWPGSRPPSDRRCATLNPAPSSRAT